jgi:hypothetical protein
MHRAILLKRWRHLPTDGTPCQILYSFENSKFMFLLQSFCWVNDGITFLMELYVKSCILLQIPSYVFATIILFGK